MFQHIYLFINIYSFNSRNSSLSRYRTQKVPSLRYKPLAQSNPSLKVARIYDYGKLQKENIALRARLELNLSLNKKLKLNSKLVTAVTSFYDK
jgi:hypothetical protein